ncbi:unnamed protein product, partial [Didymodactylos carnosus]
IVMSIGTSPFYTLGVTYLCDYLHKDDQSICTSILYGMVALGPALGFLMGSALLSQWINVGQKVPNNLNTHDPRWTGRWWAGFLVSASTLTILGLLLFTFPRKMIQPDHSRSKHDVPQDEHQQQTSITAQSPAAVETQSSVDIARSSTSVCALGNAATRKHTLPKIKAHPNVINAFKLSSLKDIFTSVRDLLLNFTYLLIVLVNSVESILIVSFTTYMVKYIESVFHLSSSVSSILTGAIVIPAAVFGTVFGGWLVRRYHMGIRGCVKLILGGCIISWAGLISLLFLSCKHPAIVTSPKNRIFKKKYYRFLKMCCKKIKLLGKILNVDNVDMIICENKSIFYSFICSSDSLIDQCVESCSCSPYVFEPVCYENRVTYLSPCHAGCTYSNGTGYYNCSCVLGNEHYVKSGSCNNPCYLKMIFFMAILFMVTFFQTIGATPQLIIILRSVQHELQSFALGLENMIIKLVAHIPAPIIFGTIIDNTCLFWNRNCERRGSCFLYNGDRLPLTLFGAAMVIKGISLTLLISLLCITIKMANCQSPSTTPNEAPQSSPLPASADFIEPQINTTASTIIQQKKKDEIEEERNRLLNITQS